MASFLSNLTYVATDAVTAQAMGMAVDYIEGILGGGKGGKLKFYWQYELGGSIVNVLTRGAVFSAASYLSDVVVDQYKKILKLDDEKVWNERVSSAARRKLIYEHRTKEENKYGRINVNKKSTQSIAIYALDHAGNMCVDAVMLAIPVSPNITVSQNVVNPYSGDSATKYVASKPFQSDTLVWYDTTAMVSVNSDKNLILTQVQGRDYSRKELVSNGDFVFTVSGRICSELPDVYPEEEVQKFKQIMRYKGVVEVNNQIFDQFDIDRVVIQNFSIQSREGEKSQQEYTFTCVGLQPEKERVVTEDTVTIINQEIAGQTEVKEDGWSSMLKNKFDNLKRSSVDWASQGLGLAVGILDGKLSKL